MVFDDRVFADRNDAGRQLGELVNAHLGTAAQGALVLALPRGGVPIGLAVAEAIGGDLDVVVARKIGFPGHAELAMGAVCEEGPPVFNDTVLAQAGLTADELAGLVEAQRQEARRRMRRYRGDRPPPPIAGRLVIVVDDGLATGATARAALRSVRTRDPARLIFAAPVCAADAPTILRDADEVLCVTAPEQLIAVGRWYDRFEQLTDAEVDHHLAVAHHAA